ncbi:hypothetical protein ACFL4E_01340 [Candidatus Omnitrophota bacterium]
MMEKSRGVTIYGFAIVAYGVYNLLGLTNYKNFWMMLEGLPSVIITLIYLFTCLYAVCGVYCGLRILRLEEWARKVMITLTSISVLLGLALNRLVMGNFKAFVESGGGGVLPDQASEVYMYAMIVMVLATLFEISVVYFFTRPNVSKQFH